MAGGQAPVSRHPELSVSMAESPLEPGPFLQTRRESLSPLEMSVAENLASMTGGGRTAGLPPLVATLLDILNNPHRPRTTVHPQKPQRLDGGNLAQDQRTLDEMTRQLIKELKTFLSSPGFAPLQKRYVTVRNAALEQVKCAQHWMGACIHERLDIMGDCASEEEKCLEVQHSQSLYLQMLALTIRQAHMYIRELQAASSGCKWEHERGCERQQADPGHHQPERRGPPERTETSNADSEPREHMILPPERRATSAFSSSPSGPAPWPAVPVSPVTSEFVPQTGCNMPPALSQARQGYDDSKQLVWSLSGTRAPMQGPPVRSPPGYSQHYVKTESHWDQQGAYWQGNDERQLNRSSPHSSYQDTRNGQPHHNSQTMHLVQPRYSGGDQGMNVPPPRTQPQNDGRRTRETFVPHQPSQNDKHTGPYSEFNVAMGEHYHSSSGRQSQSGSQGGPPSKRPRHETHNESPAQMDMYHRSQQGSSPPREALLSQRSGSSEYGLKQGNRKGSRHRLTKPAKDVLEHWLLGNAHNPYPTDATKQGLANMCGITVDQVNNWMMNARVRRNKTKRIGICTAVPPESMEALHPSHLAPPSHRLLYGSDCPDDKDGVPPVQSV